MRSLPLFLVLFVLLVRLTDSAAQAPAGSTASRSAGVTSTSENAYFAGSKLQILSPVTADLIATGGSVIVEARVGADAALAGGSVDVRGPVEEDLRVAGGTVTIRQDVGADLVAAGGNVEVVDGVQIGGDAWLAGSEVRLGGKVGNGVQIYGNRIVVAADIAGNVRLAGQEIEFTPEARIAGDLRYASPSAPTGLRAEQVGGSITRFETGHEREDDDAPDAMWLHPIFLISMLAFGILLYLLFPRAVSGVTRTLDAHPWRSLAVGFALLFTIPPLAVFLMATVIGLPIGLALLLLYPLVLLLGYLATAFFLGKRAATAMKHEETISTQKQILFLALALLVLSLVLAIPFLGPLVLFLATVAGAGGLVSWIFLRARSPEMRANTAPQ